MSGGAAIHPDIARAGVARHVIRRGLVRRAAAVLAAAILLYLALSSARFVEISAALRQVSFGQLLILAAVNILFHGLMGLRWWLVSRDDVGGASLAGMTLARLSAFGLSYFTLGPQVGGEPLQVLYLRRSTGTSLARATATVLMDRLLELLGNFLFLVVGVALLLWRGILGGAAAIPPLAVAAILLTLSWPAIHVSLLAHGRLPVSALLRHLLPTLGRSGAIRLVRASENLAGRFCGRHPRVVVAASFVSILTCATAVLEYGLIARFLHFNLSPWESGAAWTAGWLSFLLPLPGGIGALEASQVIALGAFGVPAAVALGAAALLRLRDLVFAGLGLVLGAVSLRPAHRFDARQDMDKGPLLNDARGE